MIVLGFNHGGLGDQETPVGHDAAAALVADGRIVAAAEEERFARVKHTSRFPELAIRYCLREAGVEPADVDAFCFPWSPELDRRNMQRAPIDPAQILGRHSLRQLTHADLFTHFATRFDFTVPEPRRRRLPHHLCHAASAFYCSTFERAAYLIVDAYGELVSVSYGTAGAGGLSPLGELLLPTSLGVLYQSYTRLLGFHGRDDEYKVMGLAAYGSPERFRALFRAQWRATPEGVEHLGDEPARAAVCELGRFRRRPDEALAPVHEDIAAALQECVEEQLLHLGAVVRARSGLEDLCLAGGVALNSTANGKLARSGLFRRIFIQPAANDAGVALGAALLESHRAPAPVPRAAFSVYLGPSYSDDDVLRACERVEAEIVSREPDDLIEAAVERLVGQQVVGWFQGRMEFGPRALGNRSLLADPRRADMRERINRAVKHREVFRPFAPAILAEHAEHYFELGAQPDSPFMLMTLPVRAERAERLAAVVHRDATARVQTVTREQNPLFWRLLERFGEVTGVPALLNTSFNVNGEPIVCSPDDALESFLSTDVDVLVLGRRLIERRALELEELRGQTPCLRGGMRLETALEARDGGAGVEWRDTLCTRRHLRARLAEDEAALLLACDGSRSFGAIVDELCRGLSDPREQRATEAAAAELLRRFLRLRFVGLTRSNPGRAPE